MRLTQDQPDRAQRKLGPSSFQADCRELIVNSPRSMSPLGERASRLRVFVVFIDATSRKAGVGTPTASFTIALQPPCLPRALARHWLSQDL